MAEELVLLHGADIAFSGAIEAVHGCASADAIARLSTVHFRLAFAAAGLAISHILTPHGLNGHSMHSSWLHSCAPGSHAHCPVSAAACSLPPLQAR